jgi:hypothetical protein
VGAIRDVVAMVVRRSGMYVTLVYHSPFVHAPHNRQIHPHTYQHIFCRRDSSSVSGGNTEGNIVQSLVADESIGSGG